jgi:hypothetical protein
MVLKKTWGIVLVATLGLSLAACAPSAPEAFNASNVPCAEVQLAMTAASNTLAESEASLEEVAGTPAEVSVTEQIDDTQAELSALEERSQECNEEPTAETASDVDCAPEFVQVSAGHDQNRVIDDFAIKYAEATVNANNMSEAQITLLLEEAGKDAQVLATYSFAASLYEDPNDWEKLVEDNCLSQDGQELYYQLKGALNAQGTVVEEGDAPSNGTNTGISDDVFGAADQPGVSGDRKAIKITFPDGTVIWIMVRCGNVVYPGEPPSLLPKVPTDDPFPQGNAPDGGGQNDDQGTGVYTPPLAQPSDDVRVDQAPPSAEPAPTPPVVVPSPAASNPPTVDTGGQTNDGKVPEEGGASCNPDFQNC